MIATAPTVANVGNIHLPRMRAQSDGRPGAGAAGAGAATEAAKMRACARAGTGPASSAAPTCERVSVSAASSA